MVNMDRNISPYARHDHIQIEAAAPVHVPLMGEELFPVFLLILYDVQYAGGRPYNQGGVVCAVACATD
jgi:hypothetical protein